MGRPALLDSSTPTVEYVWFEEWRDWDGIEKHGGAEHGKAFHSVVDTFIEEEWSFYRPPQDWSQEWVPAALFPAGEDAPEDMCVSVRQSHQLSVTHVLVPPQAQAEFLPAAAALLEQCRSMPRNVWAICLQALHRDDAFVFVSEWQSATPRGHMHTEIEDAQAQLGTTLTQYSQVQAPHLLFSGPLWPQDGTAHREHP